MCFLDECKIEEDKQAKWCVRNDDDGIRNSLKTRIRQFIENMKRDKSNENDDDCSIDESEHMLSERSFCDDPVKDCV